MVDFGATNAIKYSLGHSRFIPETDKPHPRDEEGEDRRRALPKFTRQPVRARSSEQWIEAPDVYDG